MTPSAHRLQLAAITVLLFAQSHPADAAADVESYRDVLLADKPAAYWRFDTIDECCTPNETHEALRANAGDKVSLLEPGPRPPDFPAFAPENTAADFTHYERDTFLRVKDPGAKSEFDFTNGDSITLEAWIQCVEIGEGRNVYIVGKGRTGTKGFAADNQNWALRLRGQGGVACVSLLFRDEKSSGEKSWHRWTTSSGFAPGKGWHHVAVSYTFGQPESVRGYINGTSVPGAWDMGGATTIAPVVDDDEVWIGGSMGGAPQAQFPGRIDELAIYRKALQPDRVMAHAAREGAMPKLQSVTPDQRQTKGEALPVPPPVLDAGELPKGLVRVEVLEFPPAPETDAGDLAPNDSQKKKADVGQEESWARLPTEKTGEYSQPAFAITGLTGRYNNSGIKIDRSTPFLVRAAGIVRLPAGEHTLHLRALTGARVSWDGHVVVETPLKKARGGDVESVPDQASEQKVASMPLLPPGHNESQGSVSSDGQPHVMLVECLVGGKGIRPEIGELFLAVGKGSSQFTLLAPEGPAEAIGIPLTPGPWHAFAAAQREQVAALDAAGRRSPSEDSYWKQRHDLARVHAKPAPVVPAIADGNSSHNEVDRFIAEKLRKSNVAPAPLCDDAAFLRRVTLDTIGLIPTEAETVAFLADRSRDKRARAIGRLLADSRWADHWTAYWQDVLAENPNMLKGTLNNTGPFRWWIHESLLDNKPMDRFATELIRMDGSANYGGPAGFGLATQNDLPLAAKAQILSSAFLANEMKCARCHDAPFHPFEQGDLFHIAAMLGRAPLKVPATSLTQGLGKNSHVTVSLKAGQQIDPHWPFASPGAPLPGVLRQADDSRERLAATLTDPRDDRFAQVIANRVWRQFLGFGIVEPVDDWSTTVPSHPDLLRWLAHELITHDYDIKHIARLVLGSDAYQRVPLPSAMRQMKSSERLFESPARRRMRAEQLVDSLFAVAGLEFDVEPLTFDPECRQTAKDHNNLGIPRRAWELTGLSNERDRPALAKPHAQVITDVLAAFGWRESRAEPRSTRDHDPNVLQPATLANGTISNRLTRLSDENAITALALDDLAPAEFVNRLFLRILSRPPTTDESKKFTALLEPGYAGRRTGAPGLPPPPRNTKAVSWANHLNPAATTAVLAIEREVKTGPAPTPRLNAEWRERAEDAIWALMLSPEFTCLP